MVSKRKLAANRRNAKKSTGPKSAAALNAVFALEPAGEAWLSDAAATAGPPVDFTRVSMPQSSRRTSSGFAVMPAGRVMSMLKAPASVAATNNGKPRAFPAAF